MTAPLQRPSPPTVCPPGSSRAARKFSNDWKKSFQSLEKPAWIFQPLEKKFPIIGKNGANFPTIGKKFSNHWEKAERFFQSLENRRKIFPIAGKLLAVAMLVAGPFHAQAQEVEDAVPQVVLGEADLAGGYGGAKQMGMILRLLMYGLDEVGVWERMVDIPSGRLFGVNAEAERRFVEVGLSDMGTRVPQHW